MNKNMKRIIISLVLSMLLLVGETICVSAEELETVPFSMGQTLSGTMAMKGYICYQFSLNAKKTITLNTTCTEGRVNLEIRGYDDKTYFSRTGGSYDYNSITKKYTENSSVTLDKGMYLLIVSGYDILANYSIKTGVEDAGAVSGTSDTSGNITIGIRLKKKKTLQLTSVLTGISGTTTWSSSKKSVAKVNSKGKVTARKKGTATITAKCNGKTAKIKIKVY